MRKGYIGKILDIDLATKKVVAVDVDEDVGTHGGIEFRGKVLAQK